MKAIFYKLPIPAIKKKQVDVPFVVRHMYSGSYLHCPGKQHVF